MPKEEKIKMVSELKDKFSRGSIVLVTDYRGLLAKEINLLRRHLDKVGVEYKVVKNTLARLAARDAGKEKMAAFFEGPVAIALGYEDEVKPAKSLTDYIRSSGSVLKVKGGMLGDRILEPQDITTLASLPGKGAMVSQLMSQMMAPMQSIHNVLAAPMRGLLTVLQGRIKQIEE